MEQNPQCQVQSQTVRLPTDRQPKGLDYPDWRLPVKVGIRFESGGSLPSQIRLSPCNPQISGSSHPPPPFLQRRGRPIRKFHPRRSRNLPSNSESLPAKEPSATAKLSGKKDSQFGWKILVKCNFVKAIAFGIFDKALGFYVHSFPLTH